MQKKVYEEAVMKVTFFKVDEVIVASGEEFVPQITKENDQTEIL